MEENGSYSDAVDAMQMRGMQMGSGNGWLTDHGLRYFLTATFRRPQRCTF